MVVMAAVLSRALVTIAMVIALLIPTAAGSGSAAPARAAGPLAVQAPVVGFQPGNIIADGVFFAFNTMSAAGIQSFLDSKVATCQSGYTCLKGFGMATTDRAADAMCPGAYTGRTWESAAQIIYNVAQACRINPQVLIVTLQKEQGLVTHTWPSDWRYTIAMGQGCPDTAECDARYHGFFNQVYGAAWQFKRYANPSGTSQYFTWYAPGRTWNVRYHPNTACGSSPVLIQNQATANLYYYTPYQPNSAALAAGRGEGDSCSSYGNRNFFSYFTEWFGSTQSVMTTAIPEKYAELGGENGRLGGVAGGIRCGLPDGGCYQLFQNGRIYWSPTTGAAHAIVGGVLGAYAGSGFERGPLGYPTTAEACGLPQGGCYQVFERGQIHWSPATAGQVTTGAVLAAWAWQGYERGALGYPMAGLRCGLPGDGCYQMFQGGRVYAARTGTHVVLEKVLTVWGPSGFERGDLGYPLSSERCGLTAGGCYQPFEGGRIYWLAGTPPQIIRPPVLETWGATGYENGALGYPLGGLRCGLPGDGCYQMFQGGRVYTSPIGGTRSVSGAILTYWGGQGFERGRLGYPTSAAACDGGGVCRQSFQNGVVTHTPGVGTAG